MCHVAFRDTYRHGVFLLPDGPALHRYKFLVCGWCEVYQVRNVAQHRYVEETDVCKIAHAEDRRAYHIDYGRVAVYAQVLCQLVVSTLYECGVCAENGAYSAFRHSRSHCHRLLFGNSNVYELPSGRFALFRPESYGCRYASRYAHEFRVAFDFLPQPFAQQGGHVLAVACVFQFSCRYVERHVPVPRLLILRCRQVSVSFFGMYVYHCRVWCVFHAFERRYEMSDIVSLFNIHVFKAESLEEIKLCQSFCLSQQT